MAASTTARADARRIPSAALPSAARVLAVCAHPDDESFGLGAVLCAFADAGAASAVLCFTHGEASTLGDDGRDLGVVRAEELAGAAVELGVGDVELLDYRDGALDAEPLSELAAHVRDSVARLGPDLLLVLDEGGVTGHPDHERATQAALAAGADAGLGVLAWALSAPVAEALNDEFSAGFVGRGVGDVDVVLRVDRTRQHRAIARHASQATDNPVLARRLALQEDVEVLRWLRVPGS